MSQEPLKIGTIEEALARRVYLVGAFVAVIIMILLFIIAFLELGKSVLVFFHFMTGPDLRLHRSHRRSWLRSRESSICFLRRLGF